MRCLEMVGQVVCDLRAGGAEPLAQDLPDNDWGWGYVSPFCFNFCNMLWACQMYLELWAPNTYMFYVIHNMIMHLLYDNNGSPCDFFMVVFCGIHVINSDL